MSIHNCKQAGFGTEGGLGGGRNVGIQDSTMEVCTSTGFATTDDESGEGHGKEEGRSKGEQKGE